MSNTDPYLNSIFSFPGQLKLAYKESRQIKLPSDYFNISSAVIAGMGGSIFGGLVVQGTLQDTKMEIPLILVSDYLLPPFANENTLVIASSYSGNTEETIQVLNDARKRGCKVIAVSSGGKLKEYVNNEEVPGYIFDAGKYSQTPEVPRTGVGYTVGASLGILAKLGLVKYSNKDMQNLFSDVSSYCELIKDDTTKAAFLGEKIKGRIPIFVSCEHTNCAAHIWRNFFNETSKSLAFNLQIPDMNHHFLDGLEYPADASSNFVFVFLESNLYHPRNKKRFEITKSVTQKRGYENVEVKVSGKYRMLDIWEVIILGCVASRRLAAVHNADPAANEMVDYLKAELEDHRSGLN